MFFFLNLNSIGLLDGYKWDSNVMKKNLTVCFLKAMAHLDPLRGFTVLEVVILPEGTKWKKPIQIPGLIPWLSSTVRGSKWPHSQLSRRKSLAERLIFLGDIELY